MGFQPGQEMPPFQHKQFGGLHRHGFGGPAFSVKQSYLAEELALADDVERDLLALGGIAAYPHPPGQHRHHAGTRVALAENDGPGTVLGNRGIDRQLSKFTWIDMLQQGMLGKDGELSSSPVMAIRLVPRKPASLFG